jgi:hypothetical protein
MLSAGCAFLLCGCIHHHETVHRDGPRVSVDFENDTAGHLFYEALSKKNSRTPGESKTEVKLPLVFEHERRVITGPNAAFNDAVDQCDSNHDGTITEREARIFSRRVRR